MENQSDQPQKNFADLFVCLGVRKMTTTFEELNKMLDGLLNIQASENPEAHPDNDVVREGLVKGWTRLFETGGMPHDQAEGQAKLTVTRGIGGPLKESLLLAGFTEAEAQVFLKGRGGPDDLTGYEPEFSEKSDDNQDPGKKDKDPEQSHLSEAERETIINKVIALHLGKGK